jgi:hypothetical protein
MTKAFFIKVPWPQQQHQQQLQQQQQQQQQHNNEQVQHNKATKLFALLVSKNSKVLFLMVSVLSIFIVFIITLAIREFLITRLQLY